MRDWFHDLWRDPSGPTVAIVLAFLMLCAWAGALAFLLSDAGVPR